MNARLARIIDWMFEGGYVAPETRSAAVASLALVVPRREDRGRYDSGTAFFGG